MRKAIHKVLQNPEIILRSKLKERDTEILELRVQKEEVISVLKAENEALRKDLEEYKLKDSYVRALIHELKNINRDLKYDTDDLNFEEMSADELNLWSQSNLLSIVMNTYGFQYNQESDGKSFKRPIPLFKKVDKLRKCYNFRRNSDFTVVIQGSSVMGFIATEIIEVLFYILIENARKYSLKNEKLYVTFQESDSTITVVFSNKCELPAKEEVDKLTEMGYRGQNQTKDGKGIGLATFASICKTYGIEFNISIQEIDTSITRNPIGYFKVDMTFYNCISMK